MVDFLEQTNIKERNKKLQNYFDIRCKKCESWEVLIIGSDEIKYGSKYTGRYGDVGAIFKCKKCGNAVRIIVADC